MPELQRKGKRVGLHSAVFPKVGLQTQVLPTACTGKSLANCESQASGHSVVTGGEDWTVRVWDVDRGELLARLRGHTGTVYTAVFSSDGQRILTASYDKT